MELEEDVRDYILASWENARQTGQLDEDLNSEPKALFKAICNKLFKADGILVDEVMTDDIDADYVLQESLGSNSNSKKKVKPGRLKIFRESEQLAGISRYGLAKLYQKLLETAQ
jgi:hypothetical protein